MGFWLLTPLLLAAAVIAIAMRPALRRAFGWGAPLAEHPTERTAPPPLEPGPAASGPVAQPAREPVQNESAPDTPGQPLEPTEILARVRALQLGLTTLIRPGAALDQQVATALAAIGDPTRERRHFPRRPNLLPQLMHAVNDEMVAQRQLVAIIARDPALVDTLLRMANSSFYRISAQPVESIERAVAILGSDGLRSVIVTALMQPIFNTGTAAEFPHFAQWVWEHALRSAQAAIVHAAVAECNEPFAAELLCLISGLAEIVLFRVARAQCVSGVEGRRQAAAAVIAALLDAHASTLAQRIGSDWQLSEAALTALGEQCSPAVPATPLGRSVRFGRLAGALAVLHANGRIDEATVRVSLPRGALPPAHSDTLLAKLLQPYQDPRIAGAALPKRR